MSTPIFQRLELVRNAVEARLRTPVDRSVLQPGNTVTWDTACGQLSVRVISIVGSSGLSNAQMQKCLPLYQVRIGIAVMRCIATLDSQGNPPAPEAMIADVGHILEDRDDIMEALVCDILPQDNLFESVRIEDWLPTAARGGVSGGELTVTFKMTDCYDCSPHDDTEETP